MDRYRHMDVRYEGGKETFLRKASLALVALAASWLMFVAPARADHLEWAPVAVPPSEGLDLLAADSDGNSAVAVGRDDTGPVILRSTNAGQTWIRDQFPALLGAVDAELVAVSLGGGQAWAVGSYSDSADPPDEVPLVMRLAGDLSAGVAETWEVKDIAIDAPAMARPTSVALRPDGGLGLVGDVAGQVFRINGADLEDDSMPEADPNTAIAGIALHGSSGFAVGERLADADDLIEANKVRIFNAGTGPSLAWTTTTSTTNRPLADVASLDADDAVAIEAGTSPRYWEPGNFGIWERRAGDSQFNATVDSTTELSDVDTFDATNPVIAIAGHETAFNHGLVWESRDGSWTKKELSSSPLNGVTIVSRDVAIAVGDDGVVQRLAPGFHAPDPDPNPEGEGEGEGGSSGGGESGSGSGSSDPEVEIQEQNDPPADEPRRCTRPRLQGQNVTNIRVRNRVFKSKGGRKGKRSRRARRAHHAGGSARHAERHARKGRRARAARRARIRKRFAGRLIIKFRLQRKARVQIRAVRDGKIVGKTRRRVLRRGGHQMRLLYRKPPEKVQIKARLVRNCNN